MKVRVPKGLPANDRAGSRRVEPVEEPTPGARENEMWEDAQRRHKAAVILGSWEMVTWYGIAGDEVGLWNPFLNIRWLFSPSRSLDIVGIHVFLLWL